MRYSWLRQAGALVAVVVIGVLCSLPNADSAIIVSAEPGFMDTQQIITVRNVTDEPQFARGTRSDNPYCYRVNVLMRRANIAVKTFPSVDFLFKGQYLSFVYASGVDFVDPQTNLDSYLSNCCPVNPGIYYAKLSADNVWLDNKLLTSVNDNIGSVSGEMLASLYGSQFVRKIGLPTRQSDLFLADFDKIGGGFSLRFSNLTEPIGRSPKSESERRDSDSRDNTNRAVIHIYKSTDAVPTNFNKAQELSKTLLRCLIGGLIIIVACAALERRGTTYNPHKNAENNSKNQD